MIPVTPDVRITVDGNNYTIEHRSTVESGKRKGEDHWASIGNYPSVKLAALALIGRHARLIVDFEAKTELRVLATTIEHAEMAIIRAVETK